MSEENRNIERIKDLEWLVANLVDAMKDAQAGLNYIENGYGDEIYGVGFRRVEEKTKTMLLAVAKYNSENKESKCQTHY
jgi:hypothetical protein